MCGQASRWAASLAIDYFTSDNYSMELLSPSTPCTKKLSKKTSSLTPIKGQTSFSFTQCSTPNPTILSPSKRNTCDNKYSNKSTPKSDRFIPNRSKMDFSYCNYNLLYDVGMKENEEDTKSSQPQGQTTNKLKEDLFQLANYTPGKRMLSCFDACDDEPVTPAPKRECTPRKSTKKVIRTVPTAPSKVLDAPDLMDDYYLNLMSWGSNNVIAIALSNSVYLWHAVDGQIELVVSLDESEYVSSVAFCGSKDPNCLAIGTSSNEIQIWDTSRLTKVRDITGHTARVSSMSWNNSLLSSGGRDSTILHHDIRSQRSLQSTYLGHQQEVCGLSWSPDGTTLASGGNDNMLCLWDAAMSSSQRSPFSPNRRIGAQSSSPRYQIEAHSAAVKALAWCPFQRNVLASGGGTADRTIRLWNTQSGENTSTIDTGSQVCAMQWSESHRELVSSHGFSDNQLCLWKYSNGNNLTKVKELRGHTSRVLHMAKSPDGTQIVTAGADETLRFWDLFPASSAYSGESKSKLSSPLGGCNNIQFLSTGLSLR